MQYASTFKQRPLARPPAGYGTEPVPPRPASARRHADWTTPVTAPLMPGDASPAPRNAPLATRPAPLPVPPASMVPPSGPVPSAGPVLPANTVPPASDEPAPQVSVPARRSTPSGARFSLGLGLGVVAVASAFVVGSCASRGIERASLVAPAEDIGAPQMSRQAAAPGARTTVVRGPRQVAPVPPKMMHARLNAAFEEGAETVQPREKPGPSRETQRFMTAVAAPLAPEEPAVRDDRPMARFYAKLAALESGARHEPLTILHIGDSHIAADSFTRGIRSRLQKRYGDAGRGDVIPPDVFKYAYADQVSMSRSGPWQAAMSLKTSSGPFGISGVRLSSSSSRARLVMKTKTGPFDYAEVTLVTGPRAGGVVIEAGGRSERFSARAPKEGSKTVRLDASGSTVTVRPAGDGTTTVLYWGTGRNRPGIRYVNFGQVGATVSVTRRWDDAIVASNLRDLKPDLIVYGFGTNEGFNDGVDLQEYGAYASRFVAKLASAAPDADFLFIGASDGLSRRTRRGDSCSGGYRSPPKLAGIRDTIRQVARTHHAAYWDWSDAMGGRCSIDRWARQKLAAGDRVHLTRAGYDKSADLLVDALFTKSARRPVYALQN